MTAWTSPLPRCARKHIDALHARIREAGAPITRRELMHGYAASESTIDMAMREMEQRGLTRRSGVRGHARAILWEAT